MDKLLYLLLVLQYCWGGTMGCGGYTCSNGKCIDEGSKCNGINDCGDWDDEAERNCPHLLYDGNQISVGRYDLKEEGELKVVGCYGSDNKCSAFANCYPSDYGNFSPQPPPKGSYAWRFGYDTNICEGSLFTLSFYKGYRPIIYGDAVAFKFGNSDTYSYLSCKENGDQCSIVNHCIGIRYSYRESCSRETFQLYSPHIAEGTPIRNGDLIYLKLLHQRTPARWLSTGGRVKDSNWKLQTRTCPGKFKLKDNALDCKYEQMALVKRCGEDYMKIC